MSTVSMPPEASPSESNNLRDNEVRAEPGLSSQNRPRRRLLWAILILATIAALIAWNGYLDRRMGAAERQIGNLTAQLQAVKSDVTTVDGDVRTIANSLVDVASEVDAIGRLARNANIYAHSHGYSDARLKTNVSRYHDGMRDVQRIEVVSFDWKDGRSGERQIGVLAQQLVQIAPHLVTTDTEGHLHVDYAGLTPVLINALQSQQEQIELLQERVKVLEAGGPGK